jgi:hypothetical protein
MVSRECPEGVHAVITGREWSAGGSQLLQDHPEILITEVDLEEDRDREDYISVMKAQKAKDEAGNAATSEAAAAAAAAASNATLPSGGSSTAEALRGRGSNAGAHSTGRDTQDRETLLLLRHNTCHQTGQ